MELATFAPATVFPLHEAPATYSPLLPTGVDMIDRVWGGLYRGGSYLLYGRGPSGRDLITLRFAQTGVELNESTLFISTARPKDLMIQAASIGFDLREAYGQDQVKLLRVPPTLAHQGGEDVGVLRAMRDLVALVREHRPKRLVVNDFMPFVMFRSYDRLRASIVDLLEQTDVLDMTMILMMSEPGNEQSRRVVEFISSQMTGAIHLEMISEDPESTLRRLNFQPNIGHVRGRRSEPWDLGEMLKPVTVAVPAERRMLPPPPRLPEPPRARGIRLGAVATPSTGVAFKPAAVAPAFETPVASAPAPRDAFDWAPEPPTAVSWSPQATAPSPATGRAALRPGATALSSGAPQTADLMPEVPMLSAAPGGPQPPVPQPVPFNIPPVVTPAPAMPPAPSYAAPQPMAMPSAALQPTAPQPMAMPTMAPAPSYAAPQPMAPPAMTPQPMAPQPMAPQPMVPQPMAPQQMTPQPMVPQPMAPQPMASPAMASPYAYPAMEPAMPVPIGAPRTQPAAPAWEPAMPPAAPVAPTMPPAPVPAIGGFDRGTFARLLDEQFRMRALQNTPFLLVALRLEPSGPGTFGFPFVRDLFGRALRPQDALLADAQGERLVALLPAAQPEEAGALFTRFKVRLREEAPHQAEAFLNTVSAIVLRNGEATSGEAFRDANAVLAYVLDNG